MTCPPKTDLHVKLEWWIDARQRNEQKALYAGTDHWEARKKGSQTIFDCGSQGCRIMSANIKEENRIGKRYKS